MNIFISGGCKNGKTSIAEDCCVKLAKGGPLYYIATMMPFDDEDRARIQRHRESRSGKGFETLEFPLHVSECIKSSDYENGTYILDSVTALMINELYTQDSAMGNSADEMKADPNAAKRVADELLKLAKTCKNIVFVSDFIYEEAGKYSKFTEDYLMSLSYVDKAIAKECDAVAEIVLGNINMIKGELPL